LNVIMLNVIMLNVIMLNVIMLNVIMLICAKLERSTFSISGFPCTYMQGHGQNEGSTIPCPTIWEV
jgi:hypothetical protein